MESVEDYLKSLPPWKKPQGVLHVLVVLLLIAGGILLGIVVVTGGLWSLGDGFAYVREQGFRGLPLNTYEGLSMALIGLLASGVFYWVTFAAQSRYRFGGLACFAAAFLGTFWVARIGGNNSLPAEKGEALMLLRALLTMPLMLLGTYLGFRSGVQSARREALRLAEIEEALEIAHPVPLPWGPMHHSNYVYKEGDSLPASRYTYELEALLIAIKAEEAALLPAEKADWSLFEARIQYYLSVFYGPVTGNWRSGNYEPGTRWHRDYAATEEAMQFLQTQLERFGEDAPKQEYDYTQELWELETRFKDLNEKIGRWWEE